MQKKIFTLLLSFSFCLETINAQTIKGTILDYNSQMSVIGATIRVLNSEPIKGTTTDIDGKFIINDAPLGQQIVSISYIGYKTETVEVLVSSGKEAIINLTLEEDQEILQTVEVVAKKKTSSVNKLAKISSNAMNIQSVSRISGGRSDVARFVANFAGVAAQSDTKNDIIIRGNSSNGVQWRLDGIPISNPNHFASFGTTNGTFSALNSNMLAQSDFLTGAFPAEYGNALSGVIDLQLKVGNKDNHEFTTQVGAWSGAELQAEGPLLKKLNGSYAVAYRYSFADILNRVGLSPNSDGTPQYQDICYNLDFHKKKHHFNTFGLLGLSNQNHKTSEIAIKTLGRPANEYVDFLSQMQQLGFRHQWLIDETSYWKNTLLVGGSTLDNENGFDKGKATEVLNSNGKDSENSLRFSSQFNKIFSKLLTLRAGYVFQKTSYSSFFESKINNKDFWVFRDFNQHLDLHETYAQLQYKVKKRYSINAGVHAQYSPFIERISIEPRMALKLKLSNKNDLVLAYGLHSQMPILSVVMYQDANKNLPNRNLDFLRSHHFVLGWDKKLPNDWRVHAETYFQYLTNVPIQKNNPGFSILNFGSEHGDFNYENLVSEGFGRNYGVEFSLSRTFKDGFYCTLNTSLFQSQYLTSDKVWRNTAFNNRFILTTLLGKEFKFRNPNNVFTIDTKINTMGGSFYTPIDLEKSNLAKRQINKEQSAFSESMPASFQFDLRLGIRKNSRRVTHTFYFDLTNVTNQRNIIGYYYDSINQMIAPRYRNFDVLPDFIYKLQF